MGKFQHSLVRTMLISSLQTTKKLPLSLNKMRFMKRCDPTHHHFTRGLFQGDRFKGLNPAPPEMQETNPSSGHHNVTTTTGQLILSYSCPPSRQSRTLSTHTTGGRRVHPEVCRYVTTHIFLLHFLSFPVGNDNTKPTSPT